MGTKSGFLKVNVKKCKESFIENFGEEIYFKNIHESYTGIFKDPTVEDKLVTKILSENVICIYVVEEFIKQHKTSKKTSTNKA